MERYENAVFTNMVMVEDKDGRVLVQNKRSKSWGGLVFPGGHVDRGEYFTESAVREVYEETGLTIRNARIIGIKHFVTDEYRYVAILFYTNDFEGTLRSSEEGDVFWMTKEELLSRRSEMPFSFDKMLEIFFERKYTEHCMLPSESDGGWNQILC